VAAGVVAAPLLEIVVLGEAALLFGVPSAAAEEELEMGEGASAAVFRDEGEEVGLGTGIVATLVTTALSEEVGESVSAGWCFSSA
jgi:hypothetical protein